MGISDLQEFQPAFLRIQEDMERLSRLEKPSYLGVYEQMDRALEPIRKQHLEFARTFEISGVASKHLAEAVRANQHLQELFDQATASSHVFKDLAKIHQSWLDGVKPLEESIAQVQAAARRSVEDVAYKLTISEGILSGIDVSALERGLALPEMTFPNLENIFGNITSSYEKLAASLQTLPDVTQMPSFALSGATREIFTMGFALDALAYDEDAEDEASHAEIQVVTEFRRETSECVVLLQGVDPALAIPYIGARDAIQGDSADRARHAFASLRELWSHLLRRLAPDNEVLKWLPGDGNNLLHDGKPTRKARVLYVCRNVSSAPLTDFVNQDTTSLVRLIDLFNRVHELESGLTDQQLNAILLRTESWLTYLLNIWRDSK